MATSASPDPTGLEKTTGLSDAKKSFPSLDSLDTAMNQMQFAAAEPAAIGTTHGAAVRISTAGIEISMGSVGDCYDNAVCETFHASLKKEKIYRQSWPTRAAARTAVFGYIEGWYNPRRRHSTLGYLSPIEFERHYTELAQLALEGLDFA